MVSFLDRLRAYRLVAIVRGVDPEHVTITCRVLLEEGVRLVEVPLTTPGAESIIAELAADAPAGALVGAGTVLKAPQVHEVIAAGAQFIVTPAVTVAINAAVEAGVPVLAGAYSPSEAWAAHQAGASAVKLFPASAGGPSYLKALRDPFPQIPFVPVGGVDVLGAGDYFAAGAIAVGVGGPLVGDAVRGGSLDDLRRRARAFLAAVR